MTQVVERGTSGSVKDVDGAIISRGKFSGFRLIAQTAFGLKSDLVNVYGHKGACIGYILASEMDAFISGSTSGFTPQGGWRSKWSSDLITLFGLNGSAVDQAFCQSRVKLGECGDSLPMFDPQGEVPIPPAKNVSGNDQPVSHRPAANFLAAVENLSTDQLDDWYEEHVGYRLSQDDPSLIGCPEHLYAVAEMMCLHACGEGEIYAELLELIEAQAYAKLFEALKA